MDDDAGARLDAGRTDAGHVDAGRVDAGRLDAGYGDAMVDGQYTIGLAAVDQTLNGTGMGWEGEGVIAPGEWRAIGGPDSPVTLRTDPEDLPVLQYEGQTAQNPLDDDGMVQGENESMDEAVYRSLTDAQKQDWQAGDIANESYRRVNGPRSIVDTWCGWAFDKTAGYVYLNCGGHGDYGGNEVYRVDLGAESAEGLFVRLTDPHAKPTNSWSECDPVWLNDNPPSVHSYIQIQWLPRHREFVLFGGAGACGPAHGAGPNYFRFDPERIHTASRGWIRQQAPVPPGEDRHMKSILGSGGPRGRSEWIEEREVLYYGGTNGAALIDFSDPSDPQWGPAGQYWYGNVYAMPVHIPAASLPEQGQDMVMLGDSIVTFESQDEGLPRPSRSNQCLGALPDDPSFANSAAWDPHREELLFWNGYPDVWALPASAVDGCADTADDTPLEGTSTASGVFNRLEASSTHAPEGDVERIYNKWNHLRADIFIGIHAFDEGVWLYRRP
jgi:hypothetical protein